MTFTAQLHPSPATSSRSSLGLLRFLTCGSVDDGKSTLIGRLLYDGGLVHDDQIETLKRDTLKHGTTGDDPYDFALLVDGLEAEREQGITIDVAYRYFSTQNRAFIVADTPGHEQYTRNMATGASNADLAVLLLDARKGVLPQTKRHSTICSLFGIRHVVLAINKMDLVDFASDIFHHVVADYLEFARELGFESITPIPVSARLGDNVVRPSHQMTWFEGPSLLEYLETIDLASGEAEMPFRFPVQWVNRPNLDFRGFAGTVASGRIAQGDQLLVARSGQRAFIDRIVTFDGDLELAQAGDAVTLVLDQDIDVGRGDVLVRTSSEPGSVGKPMEVADHFSARLVWMDEQPLLPERSYLLRVGTAEAVARITSLKGKLDVATLKVLSAQTLTLNEVGVCNITTNSPIAFDAFKDNPALGTFILIDRTTNATAGAGRIEFALRRASNLYRQDFSIDRAARAAQKGQRSFVLWFTGLSGSGKSTIADQVERILYDRGMHTYILDGDNLRRGLNCDLGFTDVDRVENIRRAGEVARLMVDAGLIVICSFISPFRAERQMVRELLPEGEFIEIFVDTPIEECRRRDPKGLYARAEKGLIPNFTGIDSPYEIPEGADIVLSTLDRDPDDLAAQLIATLERSGLL